jgi:putative oxidoreductase
MRWLNLIGRCALAQIFLLSGVQKLTDYGGTLEYMRSAHVPGMLLPLVIAIAGGLAVLAERGAAAPSLDARAAAR